MPDRTESGVPPTLLHGIRRLENDLRYLIGHAGVLSREDRQALASLYRTISAILDAPASSEEAARS